jgi:hypothetical protein
MKKSLLLLYLSVFSAALIRAQCAFTCSNYVVSPITYSMFPTGGNNAIPMFSPNADDGYTPPVPIGFNFNFYCTTYSTVLVYTNGLIQFDIGQPSTFPLGYDAAQMIPNPNSPTILNGIVAFRMDDLDPTVGGTVTYTTIGVAPNRMFITTYSNVPIFGQPNILQSGQIVLYETTNIIEIHSASSPQSPNLATQGIENATGTLGLAPAGMNQSFWSATNIAYKFAPYTPTPPSAITGPTNVCEGTSNLYQTVPIAGATSYTWSYPAGWNGPYSSTAVTATTGASGSISVTATYTCGTSAPAQLNVSVTPAPVVSIVSTNPQILCSGNTFTIVPGGATSYTLEPGTITGPTPFVITAGVTTSYTLTGTDASNCKSFNPATSNVLVNPSPTVTSLSGSICQGQSFNMSPSGAVTYAITGGFANVTPASSGTYTYAIIGTAANGCTNTVPVVSSLTVNPNPIINVTASRPNICKGETAILTASVADTYSWSTGATTNTIALSTTLTTGNQTYTVTGTTNAGCSRSKTGSVYVFACTGIEEEVAGSTGISAYPNPSNGLLQIKFESIHKNTSLALYDATGRLVIGREATLTEMKLDLSNLAAGLYYLKVKNGNAAETLKIVKE